MIKEYEEQSYRRQCENFFVGTLQKICHYKSLVECALMLYIS